MWNKEPKKLKVYNPEISVFRLAMLVLREFVEGVVGDAQTLLPDMHVYVHLDELVEIALTRLQ